MIRPLDPLTDPRWRALVMRDPRASAFHTPEWLDALRRTYGFVPVAYTTDDTAAELREAIPFCAVTSWLTGRRLVSLPFSDHCEPLVDDPARTFELAAQAAADARRRGFRYVQLRPRIARAGAEGFASEETNYHYALDLRPDIDAIFKGIKSDNRKDIRRAERSELRHVAGNDAAFVRAYFGLHALTRSTLGVPPQPYAWFANLSRCLGDMLTVHLLLQGETPVAGLVTIRFRDQLMWKYSASHPVLDRAGMGKSLMWKSIASEKERGAAWLDMGRVEPANTGLAQFKERWGASRADLVYLRSPAAAERASRGWASGVAKGVATRLPSPLLAAAGRYAYRHMA